MEETGALGNLGIQAQLGSQDGADVGHLTGVLQQVLAIGRTVFHAADQLNQLQVQAVDTHIDAGALARLQDLVLELLAHLRHHLLDAGRVDAAVNHQLMQGQTGHLAANRIEGGQQDGVRRVVDDDLHARGSLQRTDVAALTADDAALDLVVLDREGRHGVLDGRFRSGALDGVDDDALRLLGGVQARFVHRIVDEGLRFAARLGLHVLDKHLAGVLGGHAGDVLQLLVDLRGHALALFQLGVQLGLEGVHLALLGVQVVLAAVQLALLLLELPLAGFDIVFAIAKLIVLIVHEILVLALKLEELLLGLQDLLLLDAFGLELRLLDDGVRASFGSGAADEYINCKGQGGSGNCC